jgi:hypothetical protein
VIISRYKYLLGLTLLYLAVRVTILFCAIDKVALDEELYRGNVAKELIAGASFPFFDYQRSEYEGGSLVTGVLAIPFFLLFGEKLISLKLAGLSIGAGLFMLWYLFLERFFSRRIAVLASLLLIVPPPPYLKASISSFGAQYEVNFFTILAAFIFYQVFFVKKRKSLFGLLGAVCGFGLFYHYGFFPTVVTIILFWYVFDKKFLLKNEFFIFAAGFLAGFAPWIWYNLTHHFQGLIICDQPFPYWYQRMNPVRFALRLADFVAVQVPGVLTFADPILRFKPQALLDNWFFSRAYYGVLAVSFCGLSWLNRGSLRKIFRGMIPWSRFAVSAQEIPKEAFLLILPAVYAFILSLSGIEYNVSYYEGSIYRYRQAGPIACLVPALVVIFLYGKRKESGRFPLPYSNFCIALLLGLGLVSNLNYITRDALRRASLAGIYRGYNYFDLGRVISWRYDGSSRWFDTVKKIKDGEARRYCYSGMGWGYAEEKFDADYRSYLTDRIPKIEQNYWPYAYEWIGEAMERKMRYDKSEHAVLRGSLDPKTIPYFYRGLGRQAAKEVSWGPEEALADFRDRIDEEYEPQFYYGMGIELFDVLADEPETFLRFMDKVDGRFKPALYAGLADGKEYYRSIYNVFGFGIGRVGYDIGRWKKIMSKVEEEYRPACYQRLGIEAGWRFIHDVTKYVAFLKGADPQYRPYLYKGLGIGIGWRFAYDIKGCASLIQYADREFWPSIYEGLGIGVARRYAYQKEAWVKAGKGVAEDHRAYFEEGVKSGSDFRNTGRD